MNQHKFLNFEQFPEHEKIIYIGGIVVEENKRILTKRGKTESSPGEVKFILNRIVALIVASEQKLLSLKARKKGPLHFYFSKVLAKKRMYN
ncbi:unnamed protein product [Meloidogyne enterolobii]|uniref:Uncharacterized protein n=1 Tax=Meloidogyne enterolobii TaxID=390850 RepID=A0ACB1AE36_MELEN